MKKMERFPFEQIEKIGFETKNSTKIEVDLICGGVGFDDGPADDGEWLREARRKQKDKVENKED